LIAESRGSHVRHVKQAGRHLDASFERPAIELLQGYA
jgi:hypothetical protein